MNEPVLTRVDFRLLHGQVVTGWLKKSGAKRLIIIDDATKNDQYMTMLFELAKPKDLKLDIMAFETAGKKYAEGTLIKSKPTMILIKDIAGLKAAYDAGCAFKKVQIGTTEGGAGKVAVDKCMMTEDEAKILNGLTAEGMQIYLQTNTDSRANDWEKLRGKCFPGL